MYTRETSVDYNEVWFSSLKEEKNGLQWRSGWAGVVQEALPVEEVLAAVAIEGEDAAQREDVPP